MGAENSFRVAIRSSLDLVERGEYLDALRILDASLVEAKRNGDLSSVRTLCHHAAIISRFTENLTAAKNYYQDSLAADPENARALYGLAAVNLDQGQVEIARGYATRCYVAVMRCDDEVLKRELLDLLVKHWPDIAKNAAYPPSA